MKLSKFDIGAEIISIITKGMYPDPKDAIREYIQNGIDAHSTEMSVKIRQESIVISDNGIGMDRDILRKAVRVGVSDKNPTKDVGFMGIGIYSSFHLCSMMSIYSRGGKDIPNLLEMDFGKMKGILENQKKSRLNNTIDSDELMDLQTLLESCINLTEDGAFPDNEFPTKGTRVELSGIEPEFYSSLSDFDEVKFYLQNVIPLHFDKEKFSYAESIENKINEICVSKDQRFEIIDLSLQINSQIESIFRPYTDSDFNSSEPPLTPHFEILENGEFFGVAWGCLNSVRRKLQNRQLRGFILKKQGFSIGRRENVVKFFPRGNTFFDRYSGEIIIINENILPNASRNDIEYSPLRTLFYDTLKEVADKFDDMGHKYQEESKAKEHLANINKDFKVLVGKYNEFETNPEILINHIVRIKRLDDTLSQAIRRRGFDDESEEKANKLLTNIKEFEKTVQNRVAYLAEEKKKTIKSNTNTKNQIAKNVKKIDIDEPSDKSIKYERLLDVIDDLELTYSDEFKQLIELIDEMFVQGISNSKSEYYENLVNLKTRFEQE